MIDGGGSFTVFIKCCFTCENRDICKYKNKVTRLNEKLNRIRNRFDDETSEQSEDSRYQIFECKLYKVRKLTAEEKIHLGFSSSD